MAFCTRMTHLLSVNSRFLSLSLQLPARNIPCRAVAFFNKSQSSATDSSAEKKRSKTPVGKLDQTPSKSSDKPDPFAPFPGGSNPSTGEVGGPTGPEPTRYGDWERKGRVTDF